MAQRDCDRCRGTGWASAARDSGTENAHWTQVQYGVYQCSTCNGTGKLGLTDEQLAELEKAVERLKDETPNERSSPAAQRSGGMNSSAACPPERKDCGRTKIQRAQ